MLLVALLGCVTVTGFAAGLGGLGTERLGAGSAAVAACDANGFSVSYTTSGGNVAAATVSGIADPGCEGGRLSLTLANGTTSVASAGPTTIPVDAGTTDNSVTLTVSPQPAASTVNRVHVVIAGP